MPVYDYYCENCKQDFEINKRMKDYHEKEKCPVCGKKAVRKWNQKRGPIILFQGTGFSATAKKEAFLAHGDPIIDY